MIITTDVGSNINQIIATEFILQNDSNLESGIESGRSGSYIAEYPQAIDLNQVSITPYSYQDGEDGRETNYEILEEGNGIKIAGNAWKKIDYPYNVTEDTLLSFEFRSQGVGEIQGIGIETDNIYSHWDLKFRLTGSEDVNGLGNFKYDYAYQQDDWQQFTIPLGNYYTGNFNSLVLINDNDGTNSNSESYFRNIRLYEEDTTFPQATVEMPVSVFNDGEYRFFVTYTDNLSLNLSTIDDTDIIVRGENGFEQLAKIVEIKNNNSHSVTVTYAITAEDGRWDLNDSGVYHFILQDNQVGDSRGNFIPGFTLATVHVNSFIDFNKANITSFATRDVSKIHLIEEEGKTLTLKGKTWKAIPLNYTVINTPNRTTILEFEFNSNQRGWLKGIGISTTGNSLTNQDVIFNLFGNATRDNYFPVEYQGEGWQKITIDLGKYYRGSFNSLIFINDDGNTRDINSFSAFRNVKIYDSWTPAATVQLNNVVVSNEKAKYNRQQINFSDFDITGYDPREDLAGSYTIVDGGKGLILTGNTWKKIELPRTITPDTVLTLEFYSGQLGEIHAIAFDNDNSLANGVAFAYQIAGNEYWREGTSGKLYARRYTEGWRTYYIRVGDYFTGNVQYLILINDDDANANAHSYFRHLEIYEEGQLVNSDSNHRFTISYAHPHGLNLATLDDNDIRVTGPNNFNQLAKLVGYNLRQDGSVWATYQIESPTPTWSSAHNGQYTITLEPSQVFSNSGQSLPPQTLGVFQVNVNQLSLEGVTPIWHSGFEEGYVIGQWHAHTQNYSDTGQLLPDKSSMWTVISAQQAASEGVAVVEGDRIYKGLIYNTAPTNHRPYPVIHVDEVSQNYLNVPAKPLVNRFYVWADWNPDVTRNDWQHLVTYANKDNWGTVLVLVIDSRNRVRLNHLQAPLGGYQEGNGWEYVNSPTMPLRQWVRFTTYLDYQQGVMYVWMNGQLIIRARGGRLNDGPSHHLLRAHWGLYAGGYTDNSVQYNDSIQLWTLDQPISDPTIEPLSPYDGPGW